MRRTRSLWWVPILALFSLDCLGGIFYCKEDGTTAPETDPESAYYNFSVVRFGIDVRDAHFTLSSEWGTGNDRLLVVGDGGLGLAVLTEFERAEIMILGVSGDLNAIYSNDVGETGSVHVGGVKDGEDKPLWLGFDKSAGAWMQVTHEALGNITGMGHSVACTDQGEILSLDGFTGSLIYTAPGDARLNAIAASGYGTMSLVAVGDEGLILHRHEDGVFRIETLAGGPDFSGVALSEGADSHLVFAVGDDEVWRWEDGVWSLDYHDAVEPLRDIARVDTDFWVSGTDGFVLHWDREEDIWSEAVIPGESDLDAIAGSSILPRVVAAAPGGRFYRNYDFSDWIPLGLANTRPWSDIAEGADGSLFAANCDTLQQYLGADWAPVAEAPMGVHLRRLHVVRSDLLYAIGGEEGGIDDFVYRWNGADWNIIHVATLDRFTAVWADATGDTLFATAEYGGIWRNQGEGWEITLTDAGTVDINDISGDSPRDLVAVGDGGTILRYDGEEAWTSEASGSDSDLRAVAGAVAVGDGGTVLVHDGAAWLAATVDTGEDLLDLWVGDEQAWATGANATVLRFDGVEWARLITHLPGIDLLAVEGTADKVWIGGTRGFLLHD